MIRILLTLFICSYSMASFSDAGQALPDQLEDNFYKVEDSQEEEQNLIENAPLDQDRSAHFLPSLDNEEYQGTNGAIQNRTGALMENPDPTGYYTFREKDDVKKFTNKGTTDFSITYLIDGYSYEDRNSIFKRTFEDSAEGKKGGVLLFSLNQYLSRSQLLNTKLGMNFGFGFNQGNGFFVNGEESIAQTKLWSLPLEFNAALEVNLTRYMKIQAAGGPALAGLIQTRSDKKEEDDSKRIRQIGYGYFAAAALKISLSDIFQSSVGFKSLNNYNMSKMTFDVFYKTKNVSNFKNEDIKISGSSIGLGLSFEYL